MPSSIVAHIAANAGPFITVMIMTGQSTSPCDLARYQQRLSAYPVNLHKSPGMFRRNDAFAAPSPHPLTFVGEAFRQGFESRYKYHLRCPVRLLSATIDIRHESMFEPSDEHVLALDYEPTQAQARPAHH